MLGYDNLKLTYSVGGTPLDATKRMFNHEDQIYTCRHLCPDCLGPGVPEQSHEHAKADKLARRPSVGDVDILLSAFNDWRKARYEACLVGNGKPGRGQAQYHSLNANGCR
jgi:hypothetical protein